MSASLVLLLLLPIHVLICCFWSFIRIKPIREALFYLPMAICLPVIGLICVWIATRKIDKELETPVSQLYKDADSEALKVSTGKPELDTVVPFDEVLLLSNDHSRREVMMHILRRDPFNYLDMLKTAKVSSDVEITHYATTTIMEIQRDLDIAMQNAEEEYNKNKDDIEAVNRFISALSNYIDTGLLLANRQLQLRHQLSEVLEHKLSIFQNSRSAHRLLVENEINLGSFKRASEVSAMMCEKWPSNENSWLLSLHVSMAAGNTKEKARINESIKNTNINWSRSGREEVEFLCGHIE